MHLHDISNTFVAAIRHTAAEEAASFAYKAYKPPCLPRPREEQLTMRQRNAGARPPPVPHAKRPAIINRHTSIGRPDWPSIPYVAIAKDFRASRCRRISRRFPLWASRQASGFRGKRAGQYLTHSRKSRRRRRASPFFIAFFSRSNAAHAQRLSCARPASRSLRYHERHSKRRRILATRHYQRCRYADALFRALTRQSISREILHQSQKTRKARTMPAMV